VSTTKIVPDGEVGKTVLSTVICVELPLLKADEEQLDLVIPGQLSRKHWISDACLVTIEFGAQGDQIGADAGPVRQATDSSVNITKLLSK
jgi:hypothetical protein